MIKVLQFGTVIALAIGLLGACSDKSSDDIEAGGSGGALGPNDSAAGGAHAAGNGSGSRAGGTNKGGSGARTSSSTSGSPNTGGSQTTSTSSLPPPAATCDPPITLEPTTHAKVVGTGTAGSCTEAAFRAQVLSGGVVTFNCGTAPITITLTQTITLPTDVDTVIDGGGLVTLDGGKSVRHFYFYNNNWLVNTHRLVLQRLTLRNGKAPTGDFFPQSTSNPKCAYGYKEGAGGAVYMRDGVLHVIDSQFVDNEAATLGPDVGGGAIYAVGAHEVIVTGSRFQGNRAANGGAIAMLFANPQIINSTFEDNVALGFGRNYVEDGCGMFNHEGQGGAGGLAGAVYFDGMNDDGTTYTICGSTFRNNRANEMGGALFRTPNVSVRKCAISNSTFDSNSAPVGGVSYIMMCDTEVTGSVFVGNRSGVLADGSPSTAGAFAGLWINSASVNVTNSTFADHNGPGLICEGGTGTVKNSTFSGSGIDGSLQVLNNIFVDASCKSVTGSHNIVWPSSSNCAAQGTAANPNLAPLADNGGSTVTMLPQASSVVSGVGVDCPTTDQRGEARDRSSCAAGAVEP